MFIPDTAKKLMNFYRKYKIDALGDQKTWVKVPRGFWMKIDPKDGMDIGYFLGSYEPALIALIDALVASGDTAVDIGTHKGYVTLSLAQAVGPKGKVISIDADPRVFEEMKDNCIRNDFSQVKAFPYAVSDTEGICEFSLSSCLGNSSRFPNDIARPTVTSVVKVTMKSLDQILDEAAVMANQRQISFVKIDAEGSELLVLQGMGATLRQVELPALFMEVNKGSLLAGGFSVGQLQEFLKAHGYDIFKVICNRQRLRRCVVLQHVAMDQENDPCYEILAINRLHKRWSFVEKLIR